MKKNLPTTEWSIYAYKCPFIFQRWRGGRSSRCASRAGRRAERRSPEDRNPRRSLWPRRMPIFLLSYKADLENLTDLQPQGGCDDPSYGYFLKVSSSMNDEISRFGDIGITLYLLTVFTNYWFWFSWSVRAVGRLHRERPAWRYLRWSPCPIVGAPPILYKGYSIPPGHVFVFFSLASSCHQQSYRLYFCP